MVFPGFPIPENQPLGYVRHCCLLIMLLFSHQIMSNCLQPHGLQATRLPCPRDFPGKNTGVTSRFLFQGIFWDQQCLQHWQVDSLPLSHCILPFFFFFQGVGADEVTIFAAKSKCQNSIIGQKWIFFHITNIVNIILCSVLELILTQPLSPAFGFPC